MVNPKGTTAANVSVNPNVMVKITFTNKNLSRWAGISCFGTGSFIKDNDSNSRRIFSFQDESSCFITI